MKITIEQQKQLIDFDKQQLLISKDSSVIVLTNGEHKSLDFEGISICDTPEFSQSWSKSFFIFFTGSISND